MEPKSKSVHTEEKQKVKKSIIFGTIFALGVIAILIFVVFKPFVPKGNYDDFANCLTSKDVIFYGTNWCPTCKKQKNLFGTSLKLIDFRNCDELKDECNAVGISSIPAWIINGKKYTGFLTFENLSTLSGCELQTA